MDESEDTTRLSERLRQVNVYDDGGVGVFTGSLRY